MGAFYSTQTSVYRLPIHYVPVNLSLPSLLLVFPRGTKCPAVRDLNIDVLYCAYVRGGRIREDIHLPGTRYVWPVIVQNAAGGKKNRRYAFMTMNDELRGG